MPPAAEKLSMPMQIQLPHLSRRVIIIGSLCLALVGVLGLAGTGNQGTFLWSAAHDLPVGTKLHQSDLRSIKVSAGSSELSYLTSRAKIEGEVAVRSIGKGELLPKASIGHSTAPSNNRDLSLGIALSDLPSDLAAGDLVDIYLVPRDTHSQSEKISSALLVEKVDDRGRNLGGSINLLLSIKESEVIFVTDAIALGRLVVVRHGK